MVSQFHSNSHTGRSLSARSSSFSSRSSPNNAPRCMGFQPVENPSTSDIAEVNEFLKDFAKVYDLLDVMLVVEIADPEYVYDWRKQAEDTMKAKGKAGMTSAQLKDFVDRFMPAYKEYLPGLYGNGVSTELPQLNIKIDSNRIPID
uniref:Uncharacterized protein n=1 Tax=Rhodosorus marinus TaxID=101924 RepID=A0A7S3EI88_9RHOD|mmetsp:Transcript_3811/g.16517  ORF Transcript_3811/g.16517 Transcript_3811/m.16517 type:complete len:146 (+) Transcript_3811:1264-1701(+)